MADITVGVGKTDEDNRRNVRSKTGIPYVFLETSGNIRAMKGDAQQPTTFTEQDAVNAPDTATFIAISVAIKSDGVIGVIWVDDAGTETIQYAEFDTNNDTWGTPETVDTLTNDAADIFVRATALEMDDEDFPHAIWNDDRRQMGQNLVSCNYSNRRGGSWKARVLVQETANNENFPMVGLIIGPPTDAIGQDRPIVILLHRDAAGTSSVVDVHHGDALDATAWTDALDITQNDPEDSDTIGIVIDEVGNLWIAFAGEPARNLRAIEHLASQSAWGTWETEEVVASDFDYDDPFLTVAGRFVYIVARATPVVDEEIRLFKREKAATWVEEVSGDLPDVGLFSTPKIKYGKHDRFPQSLDYIWEEGADVLYNQFVTVNRQIQKPRRTPMTTGLRV